jgi:hypothetical protein
VDPVKVTLKFRRFLAYEGRNTTEIYLRNISAIQIREPKLLSAGYIEFIYAGNQSGGVSGSALTDSDHMIKFTTESQYRDMLRAKQLIERYIANPNYREENNQSESEPVVQSTISAIDEIKKAAALRDAGVLTADEFEAFKKRMLE